MYAGFVMELEQQIDFDAARPEEFFEGLPARPAVVLIEPRENLKGARPVLIRTADLRRRMRALLGDPETVSKRLNLKNYAARIRFRVTGSRFEQTLVHWWQARALWPGNYRQRLHLFAPAFLKLNLANPYPRAYVTRRLGTGGLYVGPFATRRAAENFLEPYLDLFRIRRCQIKIRRDPKFPGCIYSEMKMCLAPCFGGCTPEEYAEETGRAAAFLRTGGSSLSDQLSRERESASEQLVFERAAALHKRLEKVEEVRRAIPELVRPIESLEAIVVVRAAERDGIALFTVRHGRIREPLVLQFGQSAGQPRSAEQIVRELLEPSSSEGDETDPEPSWPGTAQLRELEDHLALLARWFYASPREGEIFFREARPAGWPYRRILRACRRLLAPESSSRPE